MLEQFMTGLPSSRTIATRPSAVTGIDYWGPILLKPTHRRAAPGKAYVGVFVCFSTKAVHLELVADLSTPKFIQALRRFVSRRGLCSDLHSDNGRNFVGANNELRDLVSSKTHHDAIAAECNQHGIRWHFNPPRASHFGGLWEAAIKSAQKHFVRVLGTRTLAYDDMTTLLCQIESCLNSRPIAPLSDDPTDFEPLTPGHFLTGSCLKCSRFRPLQNFIKPTPPMAPCSKTVPEFVEKMALGISFYIAATYQMVQSTHSTTDRPTGDPSQQQHRTDPMANGTNLSSSSWPRRHRSSCDGPNTK
ncbi:uncharacterized protein LOC129728214 [Wyeomyia smithii]|uniref:uncharacterized protein LOC129728214 n=1 Tax=Wyeomyia smithii TaxID=174621 RepID=UPI002467E4C2|nr:uncharacterized protein LOC129728214 [Wyeomyia smithii]